MREFTSVNGRKNESFIFWLETYIRTYIPMMKLLFPSLSVLVKEV